MSDRYAAYNKLTFDYPSERVLRITFNRPESFNSVDSATHVDLEGGLAALGRPDLRHLHGA